MLTHHNIVAYEREKMTDYEFKSESYKDEDLCNLQPTQLFTEVRRCQILCLQLKRSTFVGTMDEYFQANEYWHRNMEEKPEARIKELVAHIRRISNQYDHTLLRRCKDFVDVIVDWKSHR